MGMARIDDEIYTREAQDACMNEANFANAFRHRLKADGDCLQAH